MESYQLFRRQLHVRQHLCKGNADWIGIGMESETQWQILQLTYGPVQLFPILCTMDRLYE